MFTGYTGRWLVAFRAFVQNGSYERNEVSRHCGENLMSATSFVKPMITAALAFMILHSTASSQDSAPSPSPLTPVELTATDLETFLAPLMAEQLDKNKVAGAVISVVKDGEIIFAKGYGFADVAAKTPMTPEVTLVRPGSISKLFTAIAVMQLVEQGKLDIDRDVNEYIDFAIPTPPGGVPVTLRRLMTHRAGFEEQAKELITFDQKPKALGIWLKDHQPPRLYPKGNVSSYSNYGVGLAGYIVARVSGEQYADYIEKHILRPLQMNHATFQQPPAADLRAAVSQAYFSDDQPPLPGYEMVPAAPAGALAATATDMSRFMLTLLNGGTWDGQKILNAETLATMLSPQIKTPAGEMGLQFVSFPFGGRNYIGHTGGTIAVFSNFIFLPEKNFGLFVSFNTLTSDRALVDIPRQIAERYFPSPLSPPAPIAVGASKAAVAEGVYQISQRSDSSFLKLLALVGQMRVSAKDNGAIDVAPVLGGGDAPKHMNEIEPGVFRSATGAVTSFALNTDNGGMTMQVSPPAVEFHRVPWHQDARLVLPLAALSFVIAFVSLVGWPVEAYFRYRKNATANADLAANKAQRLIRTISGLQVFVLGTFLSLVAWMGEDVSKLDGRLDSAFGGIYAGAWLSVLGAMIAVAIAFQFLRKSVGSRWMRIQHTVLAATTVVLAWFFVTYNIAGTTLKY